MNATFTGVSVMLCWSKCVYMRKTKYWLIFIVEMLLQLSFMLHLKPYTCPLIIYVRRVVYDVAVVIRGFPHCYVFPAVTFFPHILLKNIITEFDCML